MEKMDAGDPFTEENYLNFYDKIDEQVTERCEKIEKINEDYLEAYREEQYLIVNSRIKFKISIQQKIEQVSEIFQKKILILENEIKNPFEYNEVWYCE